MKKKMILCLTIMILTLANDIVVIPDGDGTTVCIVENGLVICS